ncbi:MAG: PIN domain-containing protein [Candidatus Micrarchaeota archaeon]
MLLDTCAWIEYFLKTPKGARVRTFLTEKECFTSAISIAEISEWAERENLDRKTILDLIHQLSTVLDLDRGILETGGVLKVQKRVAHANIGLVDCLIIATGRQYNLPIVSSDRHFADENTIQL